MVLETGVYPNNSALPTPQVNPFGEFYMDLQQPFVYLGGDLAILCAHNGSSQATSALFLEYVTSPPNVIAWSNSAYPASAAAGTVNTSVTVVRIHYGYGKGCPGTGGMIPNLVLTNNVAGGGSATFSAANG